MRTVVVSVHFQEQALDGVIGHAEVVQPARLRHIEFSDLSLRD